MKSNQNNVITEINLCSFTSFEVLPRDYQCTLAVKIIYKIDTYTIRITLHPVLQKPAHASLRSISLYTATETGKQSVQFINHPN